MSGPEFWNLSKSDADLLYEVPVCGCGNPEKAYELYRVELRSSGPEWPDWPERLAPFGGSRPFWQVVAYVLDDIGATEHGGSISYAWRTEKGERLLLLLNQFAAWGYEPTPCIEATTNGIAQPVWSPS